MSTFPDKHTAAHEFARVLKPGGRVGVSGITRALGPPGELADLMAWVACLGDAQPAQSYADCLAGAGFTDTMVEAHDGALTEMIRAIGARLFAAEALAGLGKLDLAGIDVPAANRMSKQALAAVAERRLGYAVVCATKPSPSAPFRRVRPGPPYFESVRK